MTLDWNQSPGWMAVVGFVITAAVSLFVSAVVFQNSWEAAAVPAVGAGVGVAIVFYLYPSLMSESGH